MIKNKKKSGVAPYLIILAIVLGIILFMVGFGFGKKGSGGNGQGSSSVKSTGAQDTHTPKISETQASKTSSEFVVVVDKATYIMPNGEHLENVNQLIDKIRKLSEPDVTINAKRAYTQSSEQIKKALNEAGIPYKWEE